MSVFCIGIGSIEPGTIADLQFFWFLNLLTLGRIDEGNVLKVCEDGRGKFKTMINYPAFVILST